MKTATLYKIIFPNGDTYIGYTTNIKRRMYDHKAIQKGKHHGRLPTGVTFIYKRIAIGTLSYIKDLEIKAIKLYYPSLNTRYAPYNKLEKYKYNYTKIFDFKMNLARDKVLTPILVR